MTRSKTGRAAAALLASVAFGGFIAGCGDDDHPMSDSARDSMMGRDDNASSAKPPASNATAAEVDAAFVRQMIPHHQMAVQMATMATSSADHAELKKLAADIIDSQTKEIASLTAIANELSVTPGRGMGHGSTDGSLKADASTLELSIDDMGMSMDMDSMHDASAFDQAWILQMIEHHEGAIAMSKAQLARGKHAGLRKIATSIIAAQQREIDEMKQWNQDWYDGKTSSESSDSGGGHMSGMH